MKPKTGKEWMAEAAGLRARIETLKDWIRSEAIRTDVCVYNILDREVCENCQCERKESTKTK